jgi:DNA-binding NtrC family response regulator
MMAGFATVENAVHSMKSGAADYIVKPFKVEEVIDLVFRVLEEDSRSRFRGLGEFRRA